MMAIKTTAFEFAHQANIERYCKILQTHLTAQKRAFIERRLAEEQAAIQSILGCPVKIDQPIDAA